MKALGAVRPGLRLPLLCVGAAALSAAGVLLVFAPLGGRASPTRAAGPSSDSACPHRIPRGESIGAAQRTTALFVTEVVLRRNPVCGYELSSTKLRRSISRRQWAAGDTPVPAFVSRHPPVAFPQASRDPEAPEAVYVISRRVLEFVVAGPGGRPEIPMMVGVAAPDAGMGAYNLVLVVDRGSWRVDRWWRVRIRSVDS